jgi:Histidine kinase-, DNA gyrase B-, and HSP90-like ATPase
MLPSLAPVGRHCPEPGTFLPARRTGHLHKAIPVFHLADAEIGLLRGRPLGLLSPHRGRVSARELLAGLLLLKRVRAAPGPGRPIAYFMCVSQCPAKNDDSFLCQAAGAQRAESEVISVEDSGCGIPSGSLESVLDPFFTTKPLGKGSGRGLYNIRLFAGNQGIAISLETREQAGTAFHVWLPQADLAGAPEQPEKGYPLTRHTLLVAGAEGEAGDRIVKMVETSLLERVDATFPPDLAAQEVVSRIQSVLGQP